MRVFTENLSEKENLPKILETLCVWLSIDKEKVEDALVEGGTMRKLVEVRWFLLLNLLIKGFLWKRKGEFSADSSRVFKTYSKFR